MVSPLGIKRESNAPRDGVVAGTEHRQTAPSPGAGKGPTPPSTDAEAALAWFLSSPKAKGIRNPGGFRRVALRNGVDPEILAEHREWLARQAAAVAFVPPPRPTVDLEEAQRNRARLASYLDAAADDPGHPLHMVARRRAARVGGRAMP
jgi:hypothetical protein